MSYGHGTDSTELRPNHGHIDFAGLPNTRDLGGLETADGRHVRSGRLLRSGTLFFARDGDLKRLRKEYHLHAVVDLRGDDELAEKPDPMRCLPLVRYVHADVMCGGIEGISQDEASKARLLELERASTDDPPAFMEAVYPDLLLSDPGIKAYRKFLKTVLDTTRGSVLWHCHVGRDRCGMASMLVEYILGVPMSVIEDDYLATNIYTDEPSSERTDANIRFIRAAVGAVDREYGSIAGYIKGALGFKDSDLNELRERYLEA